jgi:trimeric autotransporter adhesin
MIFFISSYRLSISIFARKHVNKSNYLTLSALSMSLVISTPLVYAYQAPVASVTAMASDNFSVLGDVLQPLSRDTNRLYYADFQGQGSSTDAGILSLGLGLRQLVHNKSVLGGYFFVDRERSSNKDYYTVLGPGVEMLTQTWRFRLNGYFPVGDKEYLVAQGWADEFGNYEYVDPHDNQIDDTWAYLYNSISYGGDFSVAYRFATDDHWELELRPYAYNQDYNNDLVGANAQVTFYNNDYGSVFIGDGYDNVNHNRIYAGVTFNFGKRNTDNTLANLMISSVPRNLNLTTTDTGLPSDSYFKYGEEGVEESDVYFVDVGQGSGDEAGTYEDPYTALDEVNTNDDPDANFRIESDGDSVYVADEVALTGDQTLGGYTDDYTTPATGDDQPILITELIAEGDNEVENVVIEGDGSTSSTVVVSDGATLKATNVTINGDSIGVEVGDGSTLVLADSQVNVANSDSFSEEQNVQSSSDVTGIKVGDNSTTTLTGTDVNVTGEGGLTYGVDMSLVSGATFNVEQGSQINASSSQGAVSGIYASGAADSTITINHSAVTASSTGLNTSQATGIMASVATVSGASVDINVMNGSTVTAESLSADSSRPYGISEFRNAGNLTIENSTINAVTSNGWAFGIYARDSGDITISNSEINVEAGEDGWAYGIYDEGSNVSVLDSEINVTASSNAYGIFALDVDDLETTGTDFTVISTGGGAAVHVYQR